MTTSNEDGQIPTDLSMSSDLGVQPISAVLLGHQRLDLRVGLPISLATHREHFCGPWLEWLHWCLLHCEHLGLHLGRALASRSQKWTTLLGGNVRFCCQRWPFNGNSIPRFFFMINVRIFFRIFSLYANICIINPSCVALQYWKWTLPLPSLSSDSWPMLATPQEPFHGYYIHGKAPSSRGDWGHTELLGETVGKSQVLLVKCYE